MAIQALFFDLDGTIAETEESGHRPAFNQAFAAYGVPWHWHPTLYRRLLGIAGGYERLRAYAEEMGAEFTSDRLAAIYHSKTVFYDQLIKHGQLDARHGVCRLLAEAQAQQLKLALVTTSGKGAAHTVLARIWPAGSPFDLIVCGQDVQAKKPDPEAYLQALSALGVNAADVVAFEDSVAGLQAANAAGLATVVTPSYYTRGQSFSDAFICAEHLGEVDCPARLVVNGQTRTSYLELTQLHAWLADYTTTKG